MAPIFLGWIRSNLMQIYLVNLMDFLIEPRKKPSYFPLYWLVNMDPGSLYWFIIIPL